MLKRIISPLLAAALLVVLTACRDPLATDEKPVIYLYPEEITDVSVSLALDGDLTCTYPTYSGGWHVTAHPNGTLTDSSGQTYNYLYWEGSGATDYDFSSGYCVKGSETATFLEEILAQIGLTRREANEFIVYWLPQMESNAYNLISFQSDVYTEHAQLHIDPAPDSLLRVFMAWKPVKQVVAIDPQVFPTFTRSGFTAVEWGGAKVQ